MSTETSGYESVFGTFFKEQTSLAKEILSTTKINSGGILKDDETKFRLPAVSGDVQDIEEVKRKLRSFYRLGKARKKGSSFYPAALHALKHTSGIMPGDYPFWIADPAAEQDTPGLCQLEKLIDDALASGIEGADIISFHKGALLKTIWNKLEKCGGHEASKPLLTDAIESFRNAIEIGGDDGASFNAGLSGLLEALPSSGSVIGYSPSTLMILLRLAAEKNRQASSPLKENLAKVRKDLEAIVLVETGKSPEQQDSKHLKESFNLAAGNIDFDKLAGVIPESGTESLSESRLNHIHDIITTLKQADRLLQRGPHLVIDRDILKKSDAAWYEHFSKDSVVDFPTGQGCAAAQEVFDKTYQSYGALISAYKMGKLELAGRYDKEVHGNYFSSFSWMDFSDEEMAACPPVIFVAGTASIMFDELGHYSRMLAANLPIKTILLDGDQMSNFHMNGSSKLNPYRFRQEPGMLSLAHRTVFTAQATTLTPGALFKALETGLSHFSPAMIHTLLPSEDIDDAYVALSAAVEGRAFPGFVYEGSLGDPWGCRFHVDHNPQPEKDWPVHELETEEETIESAFTYLDYIALDKRFQALMDEIPPEAWDNDVIPAGQFIIMSREERMGKLPYVWLVDDSNTLHRMMPSWPLILLAQERVDFWHYLQEESGIHNYHAERLVAEKLEQLKQDAAKEMEAMKAAHEAALEEARRKAAEQAMDQLTAVLLDMDTSALISTAAPAAPVAKPEMPAERDAQPADADEPAEEEEEVLSMDDPWIETALCTSCNECINLNGKLFVYNADKMAEIGDPKSGTFAELVKAAENCPVHIIHPGKPLTADEPGLDDLVEKAEKYN